MSFISITDILSETILQIQEQVAVNEFLFVERLHDLERLVQQKLENRGSCLRREYIDLMPKVDTIMEKRNQLQDKLHTLKEYKKKKIKFKTDIIKRNSILSVERRKQFNEVVAAGRALYQQQITLTESTFEMRENQEYKSKIEETKKLLHQCRTMNMEIERAGRQEWIQMKSALQEILDQYDTQMIHLYNDIEYLKQLQEHEKCELQRYQILCDAQSKLFHDLMQEKEVYLENVRQRKLQEIRMKIAERTIVKFIEKYYPIWKMKKMKATKKKSKYRSRYGH